MNEKYHAIDTANTAIVSLARAEQKKQERKEQKKAAQEMAEQEQPLKTSPWLEELQARLNEIEIYSGYVTDADQGLILAEERRRIIEELNEENAALGNPPRAYDDQDRFKKIVGGSFKKMGALMSSAVATLGDLGNAWYEKSHDDPALGMLETGMDEVDVSLEESMATQAKWEERADRLKAESDAELAAAKEGLSDFGKFGVDLLDSAIQLGVDAFSKAVGLGYLPFIARAFGSGAMEARHNGADLKEQILYGGAITVSEFVSEKLFGGVSKLLGNGMLDDAVEYAVEKLGASKLWNTAGKFILYSGGEGLEEALTPLIDPILETIYNDEAMVELMNNPEARKKLFGETLYSFALGFCSALVTDSVIAPLRQGDDSGILNGESIYSERTEVTDKTQETHTPFIEKVSYAQKTYSYEFSIEGKKKYSALAGSPINTVGDLATAIVTGKIDMSAVTVDYIVREGNIIVLNTRTSQALIQAGIPVSEWNTINRTGDSFFENLLDGQLHRNRLTCEGVSDVTLSGGKRNDN